MQLTMTVDDVFAHIAPLLGEEGRKTIIEIGAHDGRHSDLIRTFCRERPRYLAIEPDERNTRMMREAGLWVEDVAVSDTEEYASWYASSGVTPGTKDREHTDSSSLCRPTKHLEAHPWCNFHKPKMVMCRKLDNIVKGYFPVGPIDLIWADVQGGQLGVIRGGGATLKRTRYLFIELHPEPLYEGEPASLEELLGDLEQASERQWEVVQRYPADVLLKRVGS